VGRGREKQDESDITQNIDLIEDLENQKGDAIVDRDDLLKEIEGPETNQEVEAETPKINTALQQAEINSKPAVSTSLEQPKRVINPVHMRTLKSDIVKQKLENPSWVPKLAKKDIVSKKTESIISDAEKDYISKNPGTNTTGEIK
jgi:hypothetical protein